MAKEYFDWSLFTDPLSALELYGHSIRKSMDFDVFAGKTVFKAVILTRPLPLTGVEAQAYFDFPSAGQVPSEEELVKFVFKGRIIGTNSPHQFLPDPRELQETEDDKYKILNWKSLHTSFYGRLEELDNIDIGDVVEVRLTKDGDTYDLQNGAFVRLSEKFKGTRSDHSSAKNLSPQSAIFASEKHSQVTPKQPDRVSLRDAYVNSSLKVDRYPSPPTPEGKSGTTVWKLYTYDRLYDELGDRNLVLGIMANAVAESAFDTRVISGAETESSIGLWQMNVGTSAANARWGPPRESMSTYFQMNGGRPKEIEIPKDSEVPYYAGSLLASSHGVSTIDAETFVRTQNQPLIDTTYNIVASGENQIKFVIEAVKRMLKETDYKKIKGEVSAADWAAWFQIYFEQPSAIKSRSEYISSIESILSAHGRGSTQ